MNKLRTTILALVVSATAPVCAHADNAHRMIATTVDLTGGADSNAQLLAWKDKLPDIVAARAAIVKSNPSLNLKMADEFFTTSFSSGTTTYVISVATYNCSSSDVLPNERLCTARLLETVNGVSRVVKEVPNFPIASVRGDAGYDETSNKQMEAYTTVAFDPKKQAFAVNVYDAGDHSPNILTINLK